jgi:hypothetical protein
MKLRVLSIVVAACLVAAPAWADYQVRGRFLYRDREWSAGGFTGATADLPIRLAAVQVVDWNNPSNVLANGATDATGNFVINVIDNQVRDVYVRVQSQAAPASDFEARVFQTGVSALTPSRARRTPCALPRTSISTFCRRGLWARPAWVRHSTSSTRRSTPSISSPRCMARGRRAC